ncbi:MAG: hypothetical protein HY318_11095 [Armatimonadetes bacterium]|nr:hypothetical protein [Armatimonadota bacterium]
MEAHRMEGMTDHNSLRCCSGIRRREFLQLIGAGTVGVVTSGLPAIAGPFGTEDFDKLIPADKKLSPEWVESLFARGTRTVYRGAELEKIGMPVGGLCTGQLYLGGDGRLWHWDLFNMTAGTGAEHYANPLQPASPLSQGFALRITAGGSTQVRSLDRTGFADVSFRGEYPIGFVQYRDATVPVTVGMEVFSPFIPLNPGDSSLPATILRFTLTNTSSAHVKVELAGWMENAVCLQTAREGEGLRRTRWVNRRDVTCLEYSALPTPAPKTGREDVVFADFEKGTYEGWSVAGTAFGSGPIRKSAMPSYQGEVGGEGEWVVNTHNTRQGEDVGGGDAHTGRLTSREFLIQRKFITFHIGGGNHPGTTCLNLLIDGKTARSATGQNNNQMRKEQFDVREFEGETARIEIVDEEKGSWGNIGVDHIVLTDHPSLALRLEGRPDFGTMAWAMLGSDPSDEVVLSLPAGNLAEEVFPNLEKATVGAQVSKPFPEKLVGALKRKLPLRPGQSGTITFLLTWHFPNLTLGGVKESRGRRYASRFTSATTVTDHVARNFNHLSGETRLWRDTWYDSTLPYWFLDRTFANTSTLATSTCHWFSDGRFYGWEGVGCCAGTCTHVWHYAHAVARLFPQLERSLRERADFGLAFDPNSGLIDHRGEFRAGLAVDGQAGCILRAYREHQMSADYDFLASTWPKVRKALEYLFQLDGNGDGILEGAQHNTLDAAWFGKIPWLSSLYLAALRAGEEMAREMGDEGFASRARSVFEVGARRIDDLWNGEYYVQQADPNHRNVVGSYDGCAIDQVFGQSWAYQVGLGRIMTAEKVLSALKSLWKYNFTPDVGPFRKENQAGRWYAMPGEGGLVMTTFPGTPPPSLANDPSAWSAMYFNECMTGFEYQVAGHMIWEGMVMEGLSLTRMIHDRYHASRRNPWNEVECGDHYARAMASFGVYLAACGYEYHGPKGHLDFSPRLTPDNFRAAFTSAEGWGTFTQKRHGNVQQHTIHLKWGRLRLRSLGLTLVGNAPARTVTVKFKGKVVQSRLSSEESRVTITLATDLILQAGDKVEVSIA